MPPAGITLASLPKNFRRIRDVSRRSCDNISLGNLLRNTRADEGSLTRAARWLQEQIPVRYARRIEDFLQLPHVVVSNPHFGQVLQTYLETFEAIDNFGSVNDMARVVQFRHLVTKEMSKHGDGTRQIAEGYRQIQHAFPHIKLDDFLQKLFTSRIATRILMENFNGMHEPREGYTGIVSTGMSPLGIVQGLATDIQRLTDSIYGCSPEVEFRGNLDCTLDYIPRHVSYMMQEVLKNALRATTERHQLRTSGVTAARKLPPVIVELQQGDVHVIIKISDQGGGMPKRLQREAWQYGWTTAREDTNSHDASVFLGGCHSQSLKSELAGFGFGLPLTRLHAQYFGGDVFMQNLPGHGTDMYVVLTHLKEGTPSTEMEDLSTLLEKGSFQESSFNKVASIM